MLPKLFACHNHAIVHQHYVYLAIFIFGKITGYDVGVNITKE